MTPTTQTRHLLKPIKKEEIELQVTQFLDSQFPSLVSLEKESQALSDLKELVNRTKAASDTHQSEVRLVLRFIAESQDFIVPYSLSKQRNQKFIMCKIPHHP